MDGELEDWGEVEREGVEVMVDTARLFRLLDTTSAKLGLTATSGPLILPKSLMIDVSTGCSTSLHKLTSARGRQTLLAL